MERLYVKGICQLKCPEKEAKFRQKENLLHKFEIKEGTENNHLPEFDPGKVVKCFNRSAAGTFKADPSNLRPFSVLLSTIHYLYQEIFPMHLDNPVTVYDFMFDRLRAVRQDAIIQNLPPKQKIEIYEPIVRFLIYFGYILIYKSVNEFDSHLNNKHLLECIESLLQYYNESSESNHPFRWDIESAYLLLNLGKIKPLTRGFLINESHISEEYELCLKISLQIYLKNFAKVFRLIKKLPVLLLCVISFRLPDIRQLCFKAMSIAYSSSNSAYPVSVLTELLLYESETDAIEECRNFGIKVENGKINFLIKDFNSTNQCKLRQKLHWIDSELLNYNLVELLCYGNRVKII